MEPVDLTVKILVEIRDEIRKTNERIDETNMRLDARIDHTNTRLDEVKESLSRAIVESEIRTATSIMGLAGTLDVIKDLLTDRLDVRERVDRCEQDITVIKGRLAIK